MLSEARPFFDRKRQIEAVKYSPSGKVIASGGKVGVVHLTDIGMGMEIAMLVAD